MSSVRGHGLYHFARYVCMGDIVNRTPRSPKARLLGSRVPPPTPVSLLRGRPKTSPCGRKEGLATSLQAEVDVSPSTVSHVLCFVVP